MLVLSRKLGEKIVLPELGVTIVLLSVHGKRARIGIEGPRGIAAHREEIWRRITDEKTHSVIEPAAVVSTCNHLAVPERMAR